jgi:hypothetical protein
MKRKKPQSPEKDDKKEKTPLDNIHKMLPFTSTPELSEITLPLQNKSAEFYQQLSAIVSQDLKENRRRSNLRRKKSTYCSLLHQPKIPLAFCN